MNSYIVMVKEDYCDGQAIVIHPDGEMGGEHYVELYRTCPICIGTYRSESAEQAIKEAAQDFQADEGIFTAVQIQE